MGTQITKKLNTAVRQKGGEFRNMALRQRDRVRKVRKDVLKGHEDDVEKLRVSFLKQVSVLEARLTKVLDISITEKLAFAFGLLNVFYGGYIIGCVPQYFHVFYTVEMMILLPVRFFTYRYKQYQYFLADLCYFVNLLVLVFIWGFPTSKALFTSCYALTFGTLSWAVITWRNSLVLHSVDKTTSSAIHILPPVVFHVITHIIPADYKAVRFPGAVKVAKWSMLSGLLWASIAYLIWQSLYHYFITVRRQEKIKAGRMTSFEYLRRSYGNTVIGKFVNGLPDPLPVVAFTLIQYGYQLSTMMLCPLWYASPILSGLFMTFIFFTASYNGATYYIEIFGKRFQKELLKLQEEVEKLNQAHNDLDLSVSPTNESSSSDTPSSSTSSVGDAAEASNDIFIESDAGAKSSPALLESHAITKPADSTGSSESVSTGFSSGQEGLVDPETTTARHRNASNQQ